MTHSLSLCYNKYSGGESLHTFDSKELQVRGGTRRSRSKDLETHRRNGTKNTLPEESNEHPCSYSKAPTSSAESTGLQP
jgi:hypothetical protein